MNTYDIGDEVRITATLTDIDGNLIDPTTVVLKYKDPSGDVTEEDSPSNPSTGVYYTDISIDESGKWRWKVEATGTNAAAEESYFMIREQQIA